MQQFVRLLIDFSAVTTQSSKNVSVQKSVVNKLLTDPCGDNLNFYISLQGSDKRLFNLVDLLDVCLDNLDFFLGIVDHIN